MELPIELPIELPWMPILLAFVGSLGLTLVVFLVLVWRDRPQDPS